MKKTLLALLLAALSFPVLADDALVLPRGVLRITIAPNYGYANERWDSSGDAQDIMFGNYKSDGLKFFNVAMAFELGFTDWITGAFQWTPGWNAWSTLGFDKETYGPYTFYLNQGRLGSFYDLFFGLKAQIVGKKESPIPSTNMRFSVAAGLKVPVSGASVDERATTNLIKDEDKVLSEPDRHLWAQGIRLYYDYLFNESFFVNLYSEILLYPEQKISNGINYGADDVKVAAGYDLKFEIEPTYQTPIATGVNLKASLPVTYAMSPDYKVDGTKVDDTGGYILTTSPTLGCFFTKTYMPFELLLKYRIPLVGENNYIAYNLSLLGKFYLKF